LVRSGLRAGEIRALGSHGQTVRHHPAGAYPFTSQLGNPAVIAELTRITTVADFRARDVAAGGQGAPLAPGFHAAQFRSPAVDRVILNLGGIANITYLPSAGAQPVIGFDTGPGNTLIDQWTYRHRQQRFDRDGAWAATGRVSGALLERLLADPYFAMAPPKSTGREHFHLDWLQGHLAALGQVLAAQDVQATLLELTARSVARALTGFVPGVRELYVCGGGSHNRALMAALSERLPEMTLHTTEELGIHPDWVEAVAFAWLAHQTLEGLPGNLPSVTGARRPVILGAIYRA
jgi:anhydro-N-acetylmuramic acid kinase